MSKVDDELTRRLRGAQRPVDPDEVFPALERRRSHRERIRKVQVGVLGIAVVAASIAGFAALRAAFDSGPRDIGNAPLPRNGDIVFSRPLPDGSEHLFAVTPGVEGERLITSGGLVSYRDPDVSPDGRTIATTHMNFSASNRRYGIATVPIEGGSPVRLTDPFTHLGDPSWSPDGTRIAFAGRDTGQESSGVYVMSADGSDLRLVTELVGFELSAPDWSPDSRSLVFVGLSGASGKAQTTQPDLYSVGVDGSGLTNLTESPEVSEWSPSWSPDGDVIAYHRNEGTTVNRVELIDAEGDPVGIVFDDADAPEIGEIDWSPDGEFLAFTSGLALVDSDNEGDLDVWTIRRDGSDLRNLTTDGAMGISWAAASDLSVSPEPSPSPSPSRDPGTAGRDIGLGFPLCHVATLGNIDWYGDGTEGAAWTGTRTEADGRCPGEGGTKYVVAADLDGDGKAEPGGMGSVSPCLLCRPFATVDLDDDGVLELVVLLEASSTPSYSVFEVSVPTSERSPGIYDLYVAPPGAPEANVSANEPLRIDAGGDEGYSSEIVCEPPVIAWTWTFATVDSNEPTEVHYVEIELGEDGAFHVVGRNDYTVPPGQQIDATDHTAPSCGVDWHPDA
jgi:dipeptidyl aminopeptidase/acylaminoacyl peptidase